MFFLNSLLLIIIIICFGVSEKTSDPKGGDILKITFIIKFKGLKSHIFNKRIVVQKIVLTIKHIFFFFLLLFKRYFYRTLSFFNNAHKIFNWRDITECR